VAPKTPKNKQIKTNEKPKLKKTNEIQKTNTYRAWEFPTNRFYSSLTKGNYNIIVSFCLNGKFIQTN
jgi:hypothetical protein